MKVCFVLRPREVPWSGSITTSTSSVARVAPRTAASDHVNMAGIRSAARPSSRRVRNADRPMTDDAPARQAWGTGGLGRSPHAGATPLAPRPSRR